MSKVFVSWSGGKESCLACYRAIAGGLKVSYLANMVTEDGTRSRTHGLSAKILKLQSQAIGIPLVQRKTTWQSYESEFKKMIGEFKQEGIEGGVFGDIDLEEHREWVERVCREAGVSAYQPLWGQSQGEVLRDFVDSGFEAVVVATRADTFGEEWLGRKIDTDFVKQIIEMSQTQAVTPCGETGEYHTLVVNGPLFKQRMEITGTRKILRNDRWFLEIMNAELKAK